MPRNTETQADLRIQVAPIARRARALWLLLESEPGEPRLGRVAAVLSSAARSGELAGLFVALRGPRTVGAAWGQLGAGRTAQVWPARLVTGEARETARRLEEAVDQFLLQHGVALAQAFVPRGSDASSLQLERWGFREIGELRWMHADLTRADELVSCKSDIRLEPYDRNESRLGQIIAGTYVGSRDFPLLDGQRDMRDVIDGYRAAGAFDPTWWFYVMEGGQVRGCLLLADHPQQQQCELVYLGLLPQARGHGWGGQATRLAIETAVRRGRRGMWLAVDAANAPALAIYQAAGFRPFQQRRVFIKTSFSARAADAAPEGQGA